MDYLRSLLWPLSELLRLVLELLVPLVGGYGLAIVCLSLIVSTVLSPITGLARRLEAADKERQELMAPEIAKAKRESSGRDRFERIEEIYQAHGYHPIKSMGSLLPLLVQLPFLLAALFLLTDYPPIVGQTFLFVRDLSLPDGLLPLGGLSVNLLPLLLTAVAVLESFLRPESTVQSRIRFLIVAVVLVVLIYPFPAGVCLYWLTSNLASLVRSLVRGLRA